MSLTERHKRDGNIEFLRCLLMLLIVFHHVSYYGIWEGDGSKWYLVLLGTVLTYWHVPAFVAISGFYGIRFKWISYWRLFALLAYYGLLKALVRKTVTIDVIFSDQNWFIGVYIALLFISPVINEAVESLYAKGRLLRCWALLSLLVLFNWLPNRGLSFLWANGLGAGTVFSLSYIYFTARAASLYGFDKRLNAWHLIAVILFYLLTVTGMGCYEMARANSWGDYFAWFRYSGYDSPQTILMGIFVVLATKRYLHLPCWVQRLSLFLSPSILPVLLLHGHLAFAFLPGWKDLDQYFISRTGITNPLLVSLFVAAALYLASILIDLPRRAICYYFRCLVRNLRRSA